MYFIKCLAEKCFLQLLVIPLDDSRMSKFSLDKLKGKRKSDLEMF